MKDNELPAVAPLQAFSVGARAHKTMAESTEEFNDIEETFDEMMMRRALALGAACFSRPTGCLPWPRTRTPSSPVEENDDEGGENKTLVHNVRPR